MNKSIIVKILLSVLIFLAVAGIAYLSWQKFIKENQPVYCTEDAKLCPDGSYVGRTGPDCEFAACPADPTLNWNTYTDSQSGVTFKYPENLTTTYISAVDWPPLAQVLNQPYGCAEAGAEIERSGRTEKRLVDDRQYCRTTLLEGAAGSSYAQYAYAFPKDDKTVILTFTLRYPQCLNYDDPKKTQCLNERESFDLDAVVDRVAISLKLSAR